MNNKKSQRLGTYLSAAAVALSLVFVGIEVRNNTIATRGATMQAISDASTSAFFAMSLDREFAEILVRVFNGEALSQFTPVENIQLTQNLGAFIRGLENTYLQNREGLVSDAIFESYGWKDGITRTSYFKDFWESTAPRQVSPEFMEFFESRAQIGPD